VYDFTPDDRFLQAFELTFDLSVVAFFAPLSIGACTYLLPLDGVKYLNIIQALEEHAITVILMVPSVLNYLQNNFDEIYLPKLRYSMFCGEALLHSMMEKWSKCIPNAQIDNLYGPTEATVFCFRYRWELERSAEESVNGIVPIGQPMPDIVAFITDENRKTVPEGEKGELCLYGNQLTYGYFNDPQKTHQSFFILPEVDTDVACYATGDECYINEKGDYIFCNRLDEQVKIDGYRVEVGEIEHFVRVFDPSAQAAVVAVANAAGALELHLFIVLDKLNTESLKNHLKDRLPAYMQPKMIHVLQQLPLNDNGKTDRKALKSLALQHS
jgi:non-ribosomal peptide synthetase component F